MFRWRTKIFLGLLLLPFVAYFSVHFYLRTQLPEFTLRYETPLTQELNHYRALPFFGVMSPLPTGDQIAFIPSLTYRKGPPKRFLSKISFYVLKAETKGKERIEYFGRRSLNDTLVTLARKYTKTKDWSYASFIAASLEYAESNKWPRGWSSPFDPIARILFLEQSRRVLKEKPQNVLILQQAGEPAFLLESKSTATRPESARIWFFRRNSRHEILMTAEGGFQTLNPREIFLQSFLVDTRKDGLAFLGKELSQINIGSEEYNQLSLHDMQWPLLLLGAKLSLDPSSIHAFFHFAGLNALLFRAHTKQVTNLDLVDSLRNNVLVSERYGKDVAPDSRQTAEISRLARTLMHML